MGSGNFGSLGIIIGACIVCAFALILGDTVTGAINDQLNSNLLEDFDSARSIVELVPLVYYAAVISLPVILIINKIRT